MVDQVKSVVVRNFVERKPKSWHPYELSGGFMLVSKNGLAELGARLADRSLGMQAVRVLLAMAENCDFENRVRTGQKDLSRILEMDQSDVSKATKALVECGMVEKPENSRGYFRINPNLLWKGSGKTLKKALEMREAA